MYVYCKVVGIAKITDEQWESIQEAIQAYNELEGEKYCYSIDIEIMKNWIPLDEEILYKPIELIHKVSPDATGFLRASIAENKNFSIEHYLLNKDKDFERKYDSLFNHILKGSKEITSTIAIKSTKDAPEGDFMNFNMNIDSQSIEEHPHPYICYKNGEILVTDLTEKDLVKYKETKEIILKIKKMRGETKFVKNATRKEVFALKDRLDKYKETAEQHEFIAILKADSLIDEALYTNDQFMLNKTMYEVLENVFREHEKAIEYIAKKNKTIKHHI